MLRVLDGLPESIDVGIVAAPGVEGLAFEKPLAGPLLKQHSFPLQHLLMCFVSFFSTQVHVKHSTPAAADNVAAAASSVSAAAATLSCRMRCVASVIRQV